MRKFIKYKILGLAFVAVSIVSCETANQDVSPVISPNGKPIASFVAVPGTTVTEGDTIVYTITLDKMIDRSITFSLNQTGGTATGDDYTCDPAVLEPYTLSTELLIITHNDGVLAAPKTIIGEIGAFSIADRYLLNPSTVNPKPTITINNFVSPELNVSLAWNQEILIDSVAEDAADNIDYDFFLVSADGFDISDPFANPTITAAATGDHPEVMTLSGLDDGEYIIFADLWANNWYGSTNDSSLVAITATFTRGGTTLDLAVLQDSTQRPVANQAGFDNDAVGFDGIVAKVVVSGATYQIIDSKGTNMGTYKSSATKTKRPEIYNRK